MSLSAGTRLGTYEILSPIGAGGMGEVYRANDAKLGRQVAIKVLPDSLARDPDALTRFEREAKAVAALSHPNILAIFDYGSQEGLVYAVMELLSGQTLRDRLLEGSIPQKQAIDYAIQIARGLCAAHGKGVVHRDLKPENVFLTEDGPLKILDFGLAKLRQPASSGGSQVHTAAPLATQAGALLGTAGYMAPEQVRAEAVDERADLFALGCVLYELVSGRKAFRRDSDAETLVATLTETPTLPAGLDPRLADLLSRCLARNPEDRIGSARRLVEELETLRDAGTARFPTPRKTGAPDSVAVLPFVNESADPEIEYLSDGIAESLLDALMRLPKLRVLARSTVMRFKQRLDEPIEIGRQLGVGAVVTGRLRQRRDDVRVSCELVRVVDGARLWGQQYERPISELQAIRDEIGERLTEHLRGKSAHRTSRKPTRAAAQGTPAYQAYLRGRHLWNRWTPDSMRAAIRQYDEAILLEPTNALAWSGLADAWATLGEMKAVAPAEAFPRAKAAALKALELDEQQPEAHASLGLVRHFWEWDWAGSESSLRRAIALAPSYATAHFWYGYCLAGLARHEESLTEARLALELDPLSLIILAGAGAACFYARRYEEAIAHFRRALDIDPEFVPGRNDLARALECSGRTAEAVQEYERVIKMAGGSMTDPSAGLANSLAVAGRTGEARAMLADLSQRREGRYVSSWALAAIHARLGETSEALDWLERAETEHDSTLVWLKVHPRFDSLRTEPRFQALLARLRL